MRLSTITIALTIAFAGFAFAQQPQVSMIYQDAAACQLISGLIGGSIVKGGVLPCDQSVFVGATDIDAKTRAFSITINYTDAEGQPRSQTGITAAYPSPGGVAGGMFFYKVDNITNMTALVEPLQVIGQSATISNISK